MGLARGFPGQTFLKAAMDKVNWRGKADCLLDRYGRGPSSGLSVWILAACLLVITRILPVTIVHAQGPSTEISHAIVVRTTENVTKGRWVWLLQEAKAAGISRIDILVKQDEDKFKSKRTGRELQSGELLVSLPGETALSD